MKLYGYALLPDISTQEKIIRFQERFSEAIGGPRLGLTENLPHTSLLQHPYRIDQDYERYLTLVTSRLTSTWSSFYYQPVGWLFGGVVRTSEMLALHKRLFEVTCNLIDVAQIDQRRDLSGLTPEEQRNYRAYGYRYLGELFTPHVTIGRAPNGINDADQKIEKAFAEEFAGQQITYDRIVFYEAGEYGALKRVLCQHNLT